MLERWLQDEVWQEFDKRPTTAELKNAVKAFIAAPDKEDLYLDVLNSFETLMINEHNESHVKRISEALVETIFQKAVPFLGHFPLFVQTLRVLTCSFKYIVKRPKMNELAPILLHFCRYGSQQKGILQFRSTFFLPIFRGETFFSTFVALKGFDFLLQKICTNVISKDIGDFLILLADSGEKYEKFDCAEFFKLFVHLAGRKMIPKQNHCYVLLFIAKIFMQVSKIHNNVSIIFEELGCFRVMLDMSINVSGGDMSNICALLLNSSDDETRDTPNYVVIKNFAQFCESSEMLRWEIYYVIIPFMTNSPAEIQKVNELLPIRLWFYEYKRPFSELVYLLNSLSSVVPMIARDMLAGICTDIPSLDGYTKVLEIVHSMLMNHIIDYEFLDETGFLKSFLISAPRDVVNALFGIEYFEEDMMNVFLVSSQQSQCLVALIEHDVSYTVCADCLCKKPTECNVRTILAMKSEKATEKICQALLSAFDRSTDVCELFVNHGGLQWMLDTKIDVHTMALLLSSLVTLKRFPEIDGFISSLPEDHPIFSLKEEELESIVFGRNVAVFRPIRVVSLFHLLSESKKDRYLDPYNSFLLGSSDLPSAGYDCPLITHIGNRYLKTQHATRLLARPYSIKQFCDDEEYDHFPVFQFYSGNQPLEFNDHVSFKAISFWVKVHDLCASQIFECGIIKIALDDNDIVISSEAESARVTINPKTWNHIFIYEEDGFRSNTVIVAVNQQVTFRTRTNQQRFTYARFEYLGTNLFFLGSAIRFFKTSVLDSALLFRKGPGFMDGIGDGIERVVTPYGFESSLKYAGEKPGSCYAVPYFGFPYHFISVKKLSNLFTLLDNATTEEQFRTMFSTLLKINEITMTNVDVFWRNMVRSLKNRDTAMFINRAVVEKALVSVSKLQNSQFILATILFDDELWSSLDNELLVSVIFDYFPDVEWNNVDDFETFMATVILQNPNSSHIILKVLEHRDKLPKLIKYITDMIGMAHVMSKTDDPNWELIVARSDCPVQETIVESWTSFLTPETVGYAKSKLSFTKLKGLLLVSPVMLGVKIFHLIVSIELKSPNYIEVDESLAMVLSVLSSHRTVWEDVLLLCSKNKKFLPLLLGVIFGTSLAMINSFSNTGEMNELLRGVNQIYSDGIACALTYINDIMASRVCLFMINCCFPVSFNSPRLFVVTDDDEMSTGLIMTGSQFSDPGENSEREQILKEFRIQNPEPITIRGFLFELVTAIVVSFKLEIPKKDCVDNTAGMWFVQSGLLDLISQILFTSNKSKFVTFFASMILAVPNLQKSSGAVFIRMLIDGCLTRMDGKRNLSNISEFLRFVAFVTQNGCYDTDPALLFSGLFRGYRGSAVMAKSVEAINNIMIGVFYQCSVQDYASIAGVIASNSQLFSQILAATKSQMAWFYVFLMIAKADLESAKKLILRVSVAFKSDKEQMILGEIESSAKSTHVIALEAAFRAIVDKYESMCVSANKDFEQRGHKFVAEMQVISKQVVQEKHMANVKSFVSAHFFARGLKILDSTFKLIKEKMQWSRFMVTIHDEMISLNHFEPKCYHLSSRCFPFTAPTILTPSPYWPYYVSRERPAMEPPVPKKKERTRRRETILPPRGMSDANLLRPTAEDLIPQPREQERRPLLENSLLTATPPESQEPFKSEVIRLYESRTLQKEIAPDATNTTLIQLFESHYAEYGELRGCETVTLVRYETEIPSVLFMFDSVILGLTYATLDGDKLQLLRMTPSKELHIFMESVLIGHWGSTFLFASHVVIRMPVDMFIWARIHSLEKQTVSVWSFKNGHFLIRLPTTEQLRRFWIILERYVRRASQALPSTVNFLMRDSVNVTRNPPKAPISVEDFILIENGLNGRSFVDLSNYPMMPAPPTKKQLTSILPFAYYQFEGDSGEIPVPFYYISNFSDHLDLSLTEKRTKVFKSHRRPPMHRASMLNTEPLFAKEEKSSAIEDISETLAVRKYLENNVEKVNEWARSKFLHNIPLNRAASDTRHICEFENLLFCQRLTRVWRPSVSLGTVGDRISEFRPLSKKLLPFSDFYVVIDKESLTLSFMDGDTKKRCGMVLRDHYFAFASSICVSNNGIFLAIDYTFGMTRVYRISYVQDVPSTLTLLRDFSWNDTCFSVLSGVHWVCATAQAMEVVLWDIVTGTIIRNLKPNTHSNVTSIAIDDDLGAVWIAADTNCFLYSLNGHLLAQLSIDKPISKIAVMKHPISQSDRFAICGCTDGSIFLVCPHLDLGQSDVKELPSEHEGAIVDIIIHANNQSFISIDASGPVYIWSGTALKPPLLMLKYYKMGCVACHTNESLTKCKACGQPVCTPCMHDRDICDMCNAMLCYL